MGRVQSCFNNSRLTDLIYFSGVHNSDELTLQWEESSPVLMTPDLQMSEFVISDMWTNSSAKMDFYSTDDIDLRYSCKYTYNNNIYNSNNSMV